MNAEIIGTWQIDPTDTHSQEVYGDTIMIFKKNGDLEYIVYEEKREQRLHMTYVLQDGFIISNQPTQPMEIKTSYMILPDGRLELTFDGVTSKYIKIYSKKHGDCLFQNK